MPQIIAAILANMLGGAAAQPLGDRLRTLYRSRAVPGRSAPYRAPQLPAARAVITPRLSWGPPVPAAPEGSAQGLAARLAGRR
jgi:hypothetical protein